MVTQRILVEILVLTNILMKLNELLTQRPRIYFKWLNKLCQHKCVKVRAKKVRKKREWINFFDIEIEFKLKSYEFVES